MTKTFVLDTNVLLHNPEALTSFADNTVVVPIESLEYLDKFKDGNDEKGRNSRQVIRELDALRAKGSLGEGVSLENGGVLKIVGTVGKDILRATSLNSDIGTNRILATACHYSKNGHGLVIFVSKDINARVKADALGVRCQDFEKEKVDFSTIWKGWREYEGADSGDICAELLDKESVSAKFLDSPMANEYWLFRRSVSDAAPVMARYDMKSASLVLVPEEIDDGAWGIKPRNREQRIAFDLMLNDNIQLISLMGSAGTGKTLLALAVGLAKTIDEAVYHRILVSRPIVPVGNDIGFLPGTKTEKIVNWMQPVYDNVSFIIDGHKKGSGREMNIDYLLEAEFLELEPITYMRGRSIPRQFIIIDEAQNLTPREMKTIVTRAGTGTKMILTGDPQQIDNPYLDEDSNGLTYLVSRFHGHSEFGQILLSKSERSHLASLAARLL